MRARHSILIAALTCAIGAGFLANPAQAESVVRYGISMADIPLTTGQPDRGAGAYQFTGYTIYDPLVAWEMDVADRPGKLIPGLATEWKVNEADKTLWTLQALARASNSTTARRFDADAVVWNLEKVLQQGGTAVRPAPGVAGPPAPALGRELQEDRRHDRRDQDQGGRRALPLSDAVVPGLRARRNGRSSARTGTRWRRQPSGTGPFKLARLVPRERAELVKNEGYWNPKRIPKTDRLVLICAPEDLDAHRGAAVEPGRHDRDAAARRGGAPQAGRHAHRAERDAARLELSSLAAAGLAVDRHPAAQGAPTSRSTATPSSSL